MKKFILSIALAATLASANSQTDGPKPRMSVLADSIMKEDDLAKKLGIFNSDEAQEIIRQNPLSQLSLGHTIAQKYIDNLDKENAFLWVEKMKAVPQIYNSLWLRFYNKFAENEEYDFLNSKLTPAMDSIYRILSTSSSISSETFNYYSTRLRYMAEIGMQRNNYKDALKHLDLVFKKFKHFNDIKNFYQYVQALAEVGRSEEAIRVLATLYSSGTDFSPELRETKSWLIAKVPNGEVLFEREVESLRNEQRATFRELLARSEELYGKDLRAEIDKNKYILLSFWGTWCIPCIETHPKLKKLHKQYKDHGLQILSLASENGKDTLKMVNTLKTSIEDQELSWLHTMLKGQNTKGHPYLKYNVQGYPTKILIDREGVILGKFTGGSYTNDKNMEQLLAELMGDEESKARTIKVKSAQRAYEDFMRTVSISEQEKMYATYVQDQDTDVPEVARMQNLMLEQLVQKLLDGDKLQQALVYYPSITDFEVKGSVAILLADKLPTDQSIALLEANLDTYELDIPSAHINVYTNLLSAYLAIPQGVDVPKSEQYLRTLFSAYNFFVTDVPTAKGQVSFKQSLSYRLAKADLVQDQPTYIARVLNAYMSSDSLYQVMKPEVLKEFKTVQGLDKLLDTDRKNVSVASQMLHKLLLKEDIHGKVHGKQAIRNKYVLLDFWGSWCAPCRAGHPHLKELYEKYKDSGFEIVAIADEGRGDIDILIANWNTAVSADGLPWINLLATDRERSGFDPVKDFHVKAFPTKILIDPLGKVIATYSGASEELDAKLKAIFNK